VFLFYYTWGFLVYIVFFFKNIIEYFYVKYNQNSTIFKRDFNDLTYFEKLFLTIFYRKNIFKDSIANIYTNNNLINFRKDGYPLIFFFHLYLDKSDYNFLNLKLLIKYYGFFNNSKIFKKTINKVKNLFFKKNYKFKNNFIVFITIQTFFFKRYYNLCSSIYFKNFSYNNLVKLNWMFYIFLTKSNNLLYMYDLSKYSDWYSYNFKKTVKVDWKKKKTVKKESIIKTQYKLKRTQYLIKTYKNYNFFLKAFVKHFNNLSTITLKFNKDVFKNLTNIKLNSSWLKSLKLFYPVRFNETSLSKYIRLENLNNYLYFYIRKNRIFNKGRYSRNRQLYRTGVYWCLWLNIMLVYGLYFMFYRFTFNFGYFWWGLLIFAYSTIFSRVVKYNFFNIFYLKSEFFNFLKWMGLILTNFRLLFISFFNEVINNTFLFNNVIKNNFLVNFLYSNLLDLIVFLRNIFVIKGFGKFIYFWETFNKKDESFLKYKSILHWFTQLYKLLTF
jgi:hypothetical protein